MPFFDAVKPRVQRHFNVMGNNRASLGTKIKAFRSALKEVRVLLNRRFPKFPCPPGCSDCCYRIPIITSHVEMEYLSREMAKNYPAKVHAMEQSKDVYQIWRRWCISSGIRPLNPFDPNILQPNWAKIGIPCPFLSDLGCMLNNKPVECQFLRRTERTCDYQITPGDRPENIWEIVKRDPIMDGLINMAEAKGILANMQREITPLGESHLDVIRKWCTTFDTWLYPEKKGKFVRTPIFALLGPKR